MTQTNLARRFGQQNSSPALNNQLFWEPRILSNEADDGAQPETGTIEVTGIYKHTNRRQDSQASGVRPENQAKLGS